MSAHYVALLVLPYGDRRAYSSILQLLKRTQMKYCTPLMGPVTTRRRTHTHYVSKSRHDNYSMSQRKFSVQMLGFVAEWAGLQFNMSRFINSAV